MPGGFCGPSLDKTEATRLANMLLHVGVLRSTVICLNVRLSRTNDMSYCSNNEAKECDGVSQLMWPTYKSPSCMAQLGISNSDESIVMSETTGESAELTSQVKMLL